MQYHPATPDRWADLVTLFGNRGACGGCWCMFWRIPNQDFQAGKGDVNKKRLEEVVCKREGPAPGVLAYSDEGEPVGWCAVAPRAEYDYFTRTTSLQAVDDHPVWAVTCFFVRKDMRRKGVAAGLLNAAADFVKANGGTMIEGYPTRPKKGAMPDTFAWTGLPQSFVAAGFERVSTGGARDIMRRALVVFLMVGALANAQMKFRAEEIQQKFGIGYAVTIEDMNGDKKPDIVAINQTQAVWFENPSWTKHVILDGVTKKDNVCFAVNDIDGDGKPDLALGADWQPTNTKAGGSLQWVGSKDNWQVHAIGEEPTLHRMRWGDVDGDGRRELIVMPLHGRGNARADTADNNSWQGAGARVLVYKPGAWTTPEVADDTLHIVHNFIATDFDGKRGDEIITASREGIHVLKRAKDGKWTRAKIGEGSPGEIKMGRLSLKQRALATIEPWHGNSVVIYRENAKGLWTREPIDDQLTGGHALGWADFDGDGVDDVVAGWRDKSYGLAVYTLLNGKWTKQPIETGAMAAEDLVVGDLNGDGKPDIVAVGRASSNVKIYWNETNRN